MATINKTLFPLKVVLFCWYGATACLLPYMTIHMKDLGITVAETSIIYTILPFTQMIGSPLAGVAADKLGRYKPVLILTLCLTAAFGTAILFVPSINQPSLHLARHSLSCSGSSSLTYTIAKCHPEQTCPELGFDRSTQVDSLECALLCHDLASGLQEYSPCANVSKADLPICDNFGPTGNISFYNVTITYQFLQNAHLGKKCDYDVRTVAWDDNILDSSICSSTSQQSSNLNCSIHCEAKLPEEIEKLYHCVTTDDSRYVTFWIYFFLRVFFSACQSTCFTLLDATTLAMVDNHEGLYGRQRFWAILATAIFSPVTGFLIDHISERNGYPDYSPAFYFFNALVIITGIMVYMLDIQVVPPAEQIIKNVTKLLRLPSIIMLLVVIFWLGTVWGFIESFLFWYLLDLGSPNYLLGLTLTTGAIVGLPFLYESEWFVKKAGQVNLLILALFIYFLRCFGYSYIHSPWWCIPFEGLEAFTYHLMWVAAATYSAKLAPQSLLATIQGCVGGLHFGVGRGAGSFIGGMIMSDYGARVAFRVMGISSGVLAVLYATAHYTYFRGHSDKVLADVFSEKAKEYNEKSDGDPASRDPMIIKLSPQGNHHKEEKANGMPAGTNNIEAIALDERTNPI